MTDAENSLHDETGVRLAFLERTCWAIREALAKHDADDPSRTIRVIAQRIDWALEGKTPGQAILDELEGLSPFAPRKDDPFAERKATIGFALELTVDRPCTIRLNLDPLVSDGTGHPSGRPEETIDLPGPDQSG